MKPHSPWHFFIPRDTKNIQDYLQWKKMDEIFPVNITGIVTARDSLAIDFAKNSLRTKILMFKNLSLDDEILKQTFKVKDNYQWKIRQQRETFSKVQNIDQYFEKILYRPFDIRDIFYHDNIVFRPRRDVMRHMLDAKNLGIITPRQFKERPGAFVTEHIIGHKTVSAYDINYLFPLYLLPEEERNNPKPGVNLTRTSRNQTGFEKFSQKNIAVTYTITLFRATVENILPKNDRI